MKNLWKWFRMHGSACDGATAVEYAIMASLIAVVIFGAVLALGQALPPIFQQAANALQ